MKIQPEHNVPLARIQWLMSIRLAVITLTLIIGGITIGFSLSPQTARFYYYIIFYYCISLLYIVFMQRTSHFTFLACFQVAIDLLAVTSIVEMTMTEPINLYANFYVIVIVLSVIVLPHYGAIITAMLSSVLFVLIILYRMPFFYKLYDLSSQEVFHVTYMYITVFLGVGYLAHYISRILREKSEEIDQLRYLNNYVFRNISSGLFVVNASHTIEFVNPAAEAILEEPARELLGLDWHAVLGVNEIDSLNQRTALEAGVEMELQCSNRLAEKIPIAVTRAPVGQGNAGHVHHVVLFRDLRQSKESEKRRLDAERLEAIVEMSATIAHELRNPLASISGSAELLVDRDQEPGSKKLANIIVKETDRLSAIVDDFLSYTRLRAMEIVQTDLNELITDVIVLLYNGRELPENTRLIFRDYPEPLIRPLDAAQLKQALFNLGLNALEAMPGGGEVEFALKEHPSHTIEISVRDTGIGMSPDVKAHIYDPFFSTKIYGTGVGMTVVQKVVQSHRGSISVESVEGKGTTVHIFLPCTVPAHDRKTN